MSWAKKQAELNELEPSSENLKTILGSIIKDIRYPLMTLEQFAEHVVPTKILDDDEYIEIYTHFALKHKQKKSIRFCSESRVVIEDFVINRFQRIESRWGYNGTPDRVKFQVDCPVFLRGFGLFGAMSEIGRAHV